MRRLLTSFLLLAGLLCGSPAIAENVGSDTSVTLTTTTAILAAGEVVADTQEVTNACQVKGGGTTLSSLVLVDGDDQGAALQLWFFRSNTSMGTENSLPDLTDVEALEVIGKVPVATTDYLDAGGVRVATVDLLAQRMKCPANSNSLWVAVVVTTGTPTFATSGLTAKLWFDWDIE